MKVKLNFKIDFVLLFLEILSFIVIIKFFYFSNYDLIKDFVIFQSERKELYVSLSIAYSCSYFFYLLQVFIPNKIKKEKFIKKNNMIISGIINETNILLLCLNYFYNYDEKIISFSNKESIVLKIVNHEMPKECWSTKLNKQNLMGSNSLSDIIRNKIDRIKNDTLYNYIDVEFIDCFDIIYYECNDIKKILNSLNINDQLDSISCNISEDIKKIIDSLNEIKKFKGIKIDKFEIANDIEEKIFNVYYSIRAKNINTEENNRLYIKVNYEVMEENKNV